MQWPTQLGFAPLLLADRGLFDRDADAKFQGQKKREKN